MFQIDNIIFSKNIKDSLSTFINILDNGFKFKPCLHTNQFLIIKSLLLYFEQNLPDLNKKFFF